jgi:hypothetical protein
MRSQIVTANKLKMKGIIAYISLLFPLIGLCQSWDASYKPKYTTVLDSSKGKAFQNLCSREGLPVNATFFNLSTTDVDVFQKSLKTIVSAKSGSFPFKITKAFYKKFGFQYIGVKINGHRFIYVNAFHVESEEELTQYLNWRKEPVNACDGSEWFWGVLYSIKEEKFSQLEFNGP